MMYMNSFGSIDHYTMQKARHRYPVQILILLHVIILVKGIAVNKKDKGTSTPTVLKVRYWFITPIDWKSNDKTRELNKTALCLS